MPSKNTNRMLEDAAAAVTFAQQVRRTHRRRTERTSKQRNYDIERAEKRIANAMKPIKSARGSAPYEPQTVEAERRREAIAEASEALQRERRKLWKMKAPKENQ